MLTNYKPDLSFIDTNVWEIIFEKIYDIDLLDYLDGESSESYEERLEDLKMEYFTEGMLNLRNRKNKEIIIDVGSYGGFPNYTLLVVHDKEESQGWANSYDRPIEKTTFYRFSDLKEYLLKC